MTKRDRHSQRPKDILLLLITGIICSIFAMMFWRTFGIYGFSIFCIPSMIELATALHQRKK
jgi:hypothetical protein